MERQQREMVECPICHAQSYAEDFHHDPNCPAIEPPQHHPQPQQPRRPRFFRSRSSSRSRSTKKGAGKFRRSTKRKRKLYR